MNCFSPVYHWKTQQESQARITLLILEFSASEARRSYQTLLTQLTQPPFPLLSSPQIPGPQLTEVGCCNGDLHLGSGSNADCSPLPQLQQDALGSMVHQFSPFGKAGMNENRNQAGSRETLPRSSCIPQHPTAYV